MYCVAHAEGIVVALLAAGRSTRFGVADKLLAPLGSRPLLEWAAQAGRSLNAERYVVITDGPAAFDANAPGYERLINPSPEQGMASSLRIAAAAAERAGARALLILLADVPFVTAEHLARLVETFRDDQSRPVFSAAPDGAAQPPALFPASMFPLLQTLEGDKGARALAVEAALVQTGADILLDIDTPDDLARAQSLLP